MQLSYITIAIISMLAIIPITGSVFAQSTNTVNLSVDGTAFLPMITEPGDNPDYNRQLFIVLEYKTNDATLINSQINAVGKIYDTDGNEIDEMTYPNGFTIQDEGFIMFSKGIEDKSIFEAKINIHLTSLNGNDQLSNEIEVTVSASDPIVGY